MEKGHRYRLLIYFAALVLCLSVCFAYAEGPPTAIAAGSAVPASNHLLFSPLAGRSNFLPELNTVFVPQPSEVQVPAASADAVLQKLETQSGRPHSFLHAVFPSRRKLKLVTTHDAGHPPASTTAQLASGPDGD